MVDGYIVLAVVFVLLVLALVGLFSVLPSIGFRRYDKNSRVTLKPSDIIRNLANESDPPVKDSTYREPYESGEKARGQFGSFVNIQYYVVILLFILFDVDMVLLLAWAFDFYSLGVYPFIETIIFLLMPIFAVYYAFKEGYMRWLS
ncbi:MAG: NADH-quinone oxidoreductase subunit A [Thermoplasmata archaeon]